MKELLKKAGKSAEELEALDSYYDEHPEELELLDPRDIKTFFDECEEALGYCLSPLQLNFYVSEKTISIEYLFEEDELSEQLVRFELIEALGLDDYGLGYTLAEYYLDKGDKEKALSYYERTFKPGYDLSNHGYFKHLVKYYRLLEKNPKEELMALLAARPEKSGGKDLIDTYLLLIINLGKDDERYLEYINEAIPYATEVAREIQKGGHTHFSDSDEERNLCELHALMLEYYVSKRDYHKAFEAYKTLTDEIGRSDCTRYYHARDLYYREMLSDMSESYPELKFFEDFGYAKMKVLGNVTELKIGELISVKRDNGLEYDFKVIDKYENEDAVLVPILPLLGEGGKVFVAIGEKNGKLYLKNRLSN